jgi:hypothetical protein
MASQKLCNVSGCDKRVFAVGMCGAHYAKFRTNSGTGYIPEKICSIPSCDRPHYGRGLCRAHWKRLNRYGDPLIGGSLRHISIKDVQRPPASGRTLHPLYSTWLRMNQRCYDVEDIGYCRYGARGIQVCKRWRDDFWAFVADMGPKPTPGYTVDRRNNNGDYTPDNCHWIPRARQQRNKRTNRHITAHGVTKLLIEWSEETGIPTRTISRRIKRGLTPEEALT